MPRQTPSILHVDMDAFFASVEILKHPELAGKPVVVGGDGARGVVASCNYEARKYGIRSAMPSARAKRLCPAAVFVSGSYGDYEKYSEQMHQIFQSYTPIVEGISIDEAFLDVEGAQTLFGEPEQIAWIIRNRIWDELRLRACVGVATTKHVAKLASEAAKPTTTRDRIDPGHGVFVVQPEQSVDFLHTLPLRALWGVGPATAAKLERAGITSVKALAYASLPALASAIGQHSAEHLHDLAWNRDERQVIPFREPKSVGHEQTFARDLNNNDEVHERIVRLADAVASRLRKGAVGGRTITLKVRFGNFRTITRSTTLPKATASALVLIRTCSQMLEKIDLAGGVRLLGISVSSLEEMHVVEQMTLDAQLPDNILDRTIDEIRSRYGSASVVPAQLVTDGEARVLRTGERQWGPNQDDEKTDKKTPRKGE